MIKRLFLISGIIAFVLAALTMYFWYLPSKESPSVNTQEVPMPDSLRVAADTLNAE